MQTVSREAAINQRISIPISLPAGGMPESVVSSNPRDMGQHSPFMLDASQLKAADAVLKNPLTLHGPPGTGKTTTIGFLVWFLKTHGYQGRILAAAQSHVAVDNMLETMLREFKAGIWNENGLSSGQPSSAEVLTLSKTTSISML